MKKRILYVIIVMFIVLTIVGFVVMWFVFHPVSSIKIENEELPFDMEWGTDINSARELLSEFIYVDETSSALIYECLGYQGISGANARLMLFFSEGKLDDVIVVFSQDSTGVTTSAEMCEKLWEALNEAYSRDSLAITIDKRENREDSFFIYDKTLVSVERTDTKVTLHFLDRNNENFREKTDQVIEQAKKTKNKTVIISN